MTINQEDDGSGPDAEDVWPAMGTDFLPEYEHLWPDEPVKIFVHGRPARGVQISCIRDGNEKQRKYFYERGYRTAIEAIIDRIGEDRHGLGAEGLAMPLAFLWRHLVEMKLKDVIRASRELFFEEVEEKSAEAKALKSHNLVDIWNAAKPHLALMGNLDEPPCSVAEEMFNEWQGVDSGADGFRYPSDIKGGNSLSKVPDYLDPFHINRSMTRLYNFLDGALCEISSREDFFFQEESAEASEYGGWPSTEALGARRRRYAEGAAESRCESKATENAEAEDETA